MFHFPFLHTVIIHISKWFLSTTVWCSPPVCFISSLFRATLPLSQCSSENTITVWPHTVQPAEKASKHYCWDSDAWVYSYIHWPHHFNSLHASLMTSFLSPFSSSSGLGTCFFPIHHLAVMVLPAETTERYKRGLISQSRCQCVLQLSGKSLYRSPNLPSQLTFHRLKTSTFLLLTLNRMTMFIE